MRTALKWRANARLCGNPPKKRRATGSRLSASPQAPVMRTVSLSLIPAAVLLAFVAETATAQDITLSEPFKPGHTAKEDVRVKVTGKLALPSTEKGKPGQLVAIAGT